MNPKLHVACDKESADLIVNEVQVEWEAEPCTEKAVIKHAETCIMQQCFSLKNRLTCLNSVSNAVLTNASQCSNETGPAGGTTDSHHIILAL